MVHKNKSGEEVNADSVIIHQLSVRSVDRSRKDIKDWRSAHQAAESVYYPNRTRLYDLYEDIKLDGHLTGVIGKRFDAILNKRLRFEKAGKTVDEMAGLIESEAFRNIIEKILEVKAFGLTGFEFLPGEFLQFEEIPRKHIKPEKKVIALEQSALEGISYEGLNNVWIIEQKKDLGFLLKCAPYALWKRGDLGDWAQFVEIFGQPVRLFKFDANDIKTQTELQKVVDNAGSSLAMLIPKQADFEMMDGKTSNATGELQEKFMNACNNEMSVIVLGNTETTSNSNGGSNAKAKEHGKQQDEVTKSDLQFVRNHLNNPHFLRILKSYGLPVDGGMFNFERELDIYEAQARVNLMTVVAKHEPIAAETWYEVADIPKPENYDELKAAMQVVVEDEETTDDRPPATEEKVNKGSQKKIKDKQPATGNKQPKKIKLSYWNKLRSELADFFDPAHKD